MSTDENTGANAGPNNRTPLFLLCLVAGAIPLAARWLPEGDLRIGSFVAVSLVYLVGALWLRMRPAGKDYWELAFAFFIFALVQLLNESVPIFRGQVLHEAPVTGNPLAATIFGTVAVQLLETAIAVGAVLLLTMLSGRPLSAVYAQRGRLGVLFALSLLLFAFVVFATVRHGNRFIPTHGDVTPSRYLALAPALLVMVLSNGLQEEFLFRGLFLRKYEAAFGSKLAVLLQAIVFTFAHLGVTYTPSVALFLGLFVFPLGVITGTLMVTTKGIVTPALFHAAVDIPIYLAFLSYVS